MRFGPIDGERNALETVELDLEVRSSLCKLSSSSGSGPNRGGFATKLA
jgi:hypothetical protein